MTKKLYYTAPDVDVWTTTVTSVRQDGETYIVTLTETAFYPEGGGQPSDAGTIAGLPVLDVFDENGEVYHRLPAHPGMGAVSCVLDRKRRRDHTQQHSGQHVLSAVLVEQLGAETVGFHLGREVVTIDITAGALTEADMLAVENRANELIYANLPVETYWVTPEEAERMPFRKRPDVQGSVRVVEMKGIDLSACCGTHVKRTGEIGVIKLLKAERHRGMTRLSFLCGGRALDRANGIITDFLNIAKPADVKMETFRLHRFLRDDVGVLLQSEALLHSVNVHFDLDEQLDDYEMSGDRRQLLQVFLNLFRNAVEAKVAKTMNVTVSSRKVNHIVQLRFCDDGPGIPPSVIDHVFDPFFSTKETGTGLGLSLSKKIVELHRGTMKVQSDARGTCFLIEFPLCSQPPFLSS